MNELENALRDWDDPMGARDWELAERLIRMFREALPVEREPVEDVEAKATAEDLRLHEKCKTTWGAADFIERQQQQVTALSQQVAELEKQLAIDTLNPNRREHINQLVNRIAELEAQRHITLTGEELLIAANVAVPDWIRGIPDDLSEVDDTMKDELEDSVTLAWEDDGKIIAFLTEYPEEGSVAVNFEPPTETQGEG